MRTFSQLSEHSSADIMLVKKSQLRLSALMLQFREILKGQPSDFQMLYKTIKTEKLFITTEKLYIRETLFEQ